MEARRHGKCSASFHFLRASRYTSQFPMIPESLLVAIDQIASHCLDLAYGGAGLWSHTVLATEAEKRSGDAGALATASQISAPLEQLFCADCVLGDLDLLLSAARGPVLLH